MEVYVLVERKKNIFLKALAIILLIASVVLALLSMFAIIFLPFAVVIGALGFFICTRNYEFECSYFDGEVRFAKIINKSSRKKLKGYSMDEVMTIAPSGDRSVYRYEHEEKMKVNDYTSRTKDAKVYVMIVKGANGLEMIKFEPDEKYLDAVCVKYRQKVVR